MLVKIDFESYKSYLSKQFEYGSNENQSLSQDYFKYTWMDLKQNIFEDSLKKSPKNYFKYFLNEIFHENEINQDKIQQV